MKWYHWISCFFAGAFLANTVPHLVKGVCGDPFPSPFADPPGKGLSSPLVNVVWGLANLVVGYLLLRGGRASAANIYSLLVFFAGFACMSIQMSIIFAQKAH